MNDHCDCVCVSNLIEVVCSTSLTPNPTTTHAPFFRLYMWCPVLWTWR